MKKQIDRFCCFWLLAFKITFDKLLIKCLSYLIFFTLVTERAIELLNFFIDIPFLNTYTNTFDITASKSMATMIIFLLPIRFLFSLGVSLRKTYFNKNQENKNVDNNKK